MKWNLRLTAANKGIWKASELQRSLAEHGLVISAGKMSGLWSGLPVSLKLKDLDVICVVLGCEIGDLLIPEPEKHSAASCPRPNMRCRMSMPDRTRGDNALRPRAASLAGRCVNILWSTRKP
jgi:DNA-binding Xre family transcriptional regulator